jgi:dephospho-CoA kinase/predicted metal-dependent HD superfamily phosphohydrolase
MLIFVTGKIGSGKSTCSQALARALKPQGYVLVDADEIARGLSDTAQWREAAMRLAGSAERQTVSQACLADPAKRRALELASMSIWRERMERALEGKTRAVVDFPLALESQFLLPRADLVVGVDAGFEVRKARALARLGWNPERFDHVDGAQIGARAKMSFCDVELLNEGPAQALVEASERLARSVGALDDIQSLCEPVVGPMGWRSVVRAHCQPWRHYHGGAHLKALFDALDPELRDDPACVLAIAHHDFVYETGAHYGDNEAQSCKALSRSARDFFPQWLQLPMDEDPGAFGVVALACAMIDCTKGHAIKDPWILSAPERLRRAQAFLDADLAILGASSDEAFWRYDEDIGLEFAHAPRPGYHRLRAQAMAAFSDPERGSIYFTERAKAWEPKARARLAALAIKHERLSQCAAAETTLEAS